MEDRKVGALILFLFLFLFLLFLFLHQLVSLFSNNIEHAFKLADTFDLAFKSFIGVGDGLEIIIEFFQIGDPFFGVAGVGSWLLLICLPFLPVLPGVRGFRNDKHSVLFFALRNRPLAYNALL